MAKQKQMSGFSIKAQGGKAEIILYEVIDAYEGIGAKRFRDELKSAGDVSNIDVRINSRGGSIFDGLGIFNTLKDHPARVRVFVDGAALSMASAVAMAGDEIVMAENAFMMIHNPTGVVIGESEAMRQQADLQDKLKAQLVNIYANRTNQPPEQIAVWMDAETWMDSAEAVANGFADKTGAALSVAACADPARFPNMPRKFLSNEGASKMPETTPKTETAPAAPGPASYSEIKAVCDGADPQFICQQLEVSATVPAAQAAWMKELKNRADAAKAEVEQLKAKAAKPGSEPLATGGKSKEGASVVDAVEAWDSILASYTKTGMALSKAISKAVREHPEEHSAYLAAYNDQRKRPMDPHYAR